MRPAPAAPRLARNPAPHILLMLWGAAWALAPAPHAAEFPRPPAARWSQTVPALTGASAHGIAATDGGYIVAGTRRDAVDPTDTWGVLVRLGAGGAVADSAEFREADRTEARAVAPVYGAGGAVTGYAATGTRFREFSPDRPSYYDPWVWLLRVDADLGKLWDHTYGSPFPDRGNAVIPDGGGFLVGGWEGLGGIPETGNGYLVHTDTAGTATWEYRGGAPDPTTWWLAHEVHDLRRTADGGLLVATGRGIVRTDAAVPPAQVWTYGTDAYHGILPLADGCVAVGQTEIAQAGGGTHLDLVLTRLASDGTEVWTRTFGRATPALGAAGTDDYGRAVIQTRDGGFAAVGTTESLAWHGGSDLWLLKTDADGTLEWDLALGDAGHDLGDALVEAPSGDLVVAGSVAWEGTRRMWVAAIDPALQPPLPAFTYTPSSPFGVEETATFDGSGSSDPDGVPVAWEWDFGDGVSGSGETASHVFLEPAVHTVTLYVTDDSGVRRSVSRSLTTAPLQTQWQRFFGDVHDFGTALALAPDGGLVVAGSYCLVTTDCDLWVFKTDERGRVLWQHTYRDAVAPYNTEGARAVAAAPGGGYVLAGFRDTGGDAGAGRDLWLLQVDDADGTIQWQQHYGAAGSPDEGYGVTPRPGGGYLVTGYTVVPDDPPVRSAWLLATDADGGLLWQTPLSDPGRDHSEGHGVAATADGGFAVTGKLWDPGGSRPPVLTVGGTDGGTETWRTETGPRAWQNQGAWVTEAPEGGFAVAATLDNQAVLLKLDAAGRREWISTPHNEFLGEYAIGGARGASRGYWLVGYAGVTDVYNDLLLRRIGPAGAIAWERTFTVDGQRVYEDGQAVAPLADGGVVVLGSVNGTGTEGSTWLFKLGPNTPPTEVAFQVAPTSPAAGSAASFTATATDPDGTVSFYEWNFGDGGYPVTTAAASQDHTFARAGSYPVILTAVDDAGGEGLALGTVTVTAGGGGTDLCPDDPAKTDPGVCGCGVADTDRDLDGTADCRDGCPEDPAKTAPGTCGCGVADADIDGDGTLDCADACPADPDKVAAGICGCGVADTDGDGDGAADCVEAGRDGDGDGVDDSTQAHVCTLPTGDGAAQVTLVGEPGASLRGVAAVANPSPADAPADAEFGYGFFAFTVTGLAPGAATTVALHLPAGATPSTYYKYGPTPGRPAPHWYEFAWDGATGAVIASNVVTLHLVDGQRGDEDLDGSNGRIVDPGGPATVRAPAPADGGGGGGGCFLQLAAPPRR